LRKKDISYIKIDDPFSYLSQVLKAVQLKNVTSDGINDNSKTPNLVNTPCAEELLGLS